MSFTLVPGNSLGCAVNSHRHRWDGSICEQAAAWNCGAEQHFREDYCERMDPRCFHMHAFEPSNPYLVIPQSGVGWILEANAAALNDQILLLWGPQFQEPRGVRDGHRTFHVFGAYRVQSVERLSHGPHIHYHIHPYPDGWSEFHELRVPRPYYQTAGGAYIKQVERRSVDRVFQEAWETAQREWEDPMHDERKKRLLAFKDYCDEWMRVASGRAQKFTSQAAVTGGVQNPTTSQNQPFRNFTKLLASKIPAEVVAESSPVPSDLEIERPTAARTTSVITDGPDDDTPIASGEPLVEVSMRDRIVERYGRDTLTSILVGALTKPFLVFRGEPGVGKSYLATNLIEDPDGDRTLIVPVSSTWRGREDLLGHVNPIDNTFEATNFTRFLYEAQKAWDEGERRNRLVIFEEFNLSQPEFWLSDVLVRCQYKVEERQQRTLELGGRKVQGLDEVDASGVYLAPNVRFVATINADLTTRPLSPRVLDRVAVVELSVEPRNALDAVGLELIEEQESAITELASIIKPKGATFSIRTAKSLKRCLQSLEPLGITAWDALDLILLQEVLTKVRLLAGDPSDHGILRGLDAWTDDHGGKLRRCVGAISGWKEMLSEGQDVMQA